MNRTEFLYSYSHYRGEVKPQHLVFNANLQEFAQRVSYIVNLETAGKLSPPDAYEQIEALWQQLQSSWQGLEKGHWA
jgi:glutathione peroxidase-family protein